MGKTNLVHIYNTIDKTTTTDGRSLKSPTTFVRDSTDRPLAAFCINFATTDFYNAGQLEENSTFLLKGAVEQVAQVMGVTKFTVYNYLKKVRNSTSTVEPEE